MNKEISLSKIKLNGPLGKALDISVCNRLKKINYTELVDPFRFRNETDYKWRCEFWGKTIRSAILAWKYTQDDELLAIIKTTVKDIISTQTSDGCISSYPADKQLLGWDIWGRKYVLAGLLRYYEIVEKSPEVLNACCKLADNLLEQLDDYVFYYGRHCGLAAASILKYILKLYKLNNNEKYLEMARGIIAYGASSRHDMFTDAAENCPPAELANGKAYEMTSCFEGLAEYYNLFPEDKHLQAVLKYYANVRDYEIYITGTGGFKDFCGEYWYSSAKKQTWLHGGSMGETCVTTTWLHYCQYILELTADSTVADEMERSAYNALLGAMKPDGTNWIHRNPTPLAAPSYKIQSEPQMPDFGDYDCCLAQGPEGLATAVNNAFSAKDKLYINFYEDAQVDFSVKNCNISMTLSGNYPVENSVKIKFDMAEKTEFSLALRIPAWSENTVIKLNGKIFTPEKGKYFEIEQQWSPETEIEIIFDMKLQKISAPGNADYFAFKRGPIVLAQDSRLDKNSEDKFLFTTESDGRKLCDYASAGNEFSPENTLQVWFRK